MLLSLFDPTEDGHEKMDWMRSINRIRRNCSLVTFD